MNTKHRTNEPFLAATWIRPPRLCDHLRFIRVHVDELLRAAKPGEVTHVHAYHDDDCRIFQGEPCNCEPDIRVEPDKAVLSD